CYITSHHGKVSRLWLVSGEIDSGKYVTGVSAKRVPPHTKATKFCPELPARFDHMVLDNGFWLGASGQALTNRFRKASHVAENWRMFDYARTFKAKSC